MPRGPPSPAHAPLSAASPRKSPLSRVLRNVGAFFGMTAADSNQQTSQQQHQQQPRKRTRTTRNGRAQDEINQSTDDSSQAEASEDEDMTDESDAEAARPSVRSAAAGRAAVAFQLPTSEGRTRATPITSHTPSKSNGRVQISEPRSHKAAAGSQKQTAAAAAASTPAPAAASSSAKAKPAQNGRSLLPTTNNKSHSKSHSKSSKHELESIDDSDDDDDDDEEAEDEPEESSSASTKRNVTSTARRPLPAPVSVKASTPATKSKGPTPKSTPQLRPTTPGRTPTGIAASSMFDDGFFKFQMAATDAASAAAFDAVRANTEHKSGAFSSAAPAAASAAAAASSASSSSGPAVSALPPHPLYFAHGHGAYSGRTGVSSSSANNSTPKKRALADHHNSSYHSAATGTPLTHPTYYLHAPQQIPPYTHFRLRHKTPKQIAAIRAKKQRNLTATFTQSTTPSTAALLAAASKPAKKGSSPALTVAATPAAAASAPLSKGKKRDAPSAIKAPPYLELFHSYRHRHTCAQPPDADWLWQALQHRGPFSSVDTIDGVEAATAGGPAAAAAAASSSSSSSSPSSLSPLSPFSSALPLHQSSIAPYFQFGDCDEENLRLYTGLRAFVRYHRLRGLVSAHAHAQQQQQQHGRKAPSKGKGAAAAAAVASSSSSVDGPPDAILAALVEIDRARHSGDGGAMSDVDLVTVDEEDDEMDTSDGAHSRSTRAAAAAAAGDLTPFMRALRSTRLLPTSLSMPCELLHKANESFFWIPMATQLMHGRFAPFLPPATAPAGGGGWKAPQEKYQCITSFGGKKATSGSGSSEEAWIERNEKELPPSHKGLVRLFCAHVRLPLKESIASAVAHAHQPAPAPLRDSLYHFNLTAFTAALLAHLYKSTDCHKFVLAVHPQTDRLGTYHKEIIKNPMCLYDVDMRLVCGYYDSPVEVLSDVWRCFENTLLFHLKTFHRHANESKIDAEERERETNQLSRSMVSEVRKIWTDVKRFVEDHFVAFMTHTPVQGGAPSPRTTDKCVRETKVQLRQWMDEVGQRDVQTLRFLWIAKREIELPNRKVPTQPLSQWYQYHDPPPAARAHGDVDEQPRKKHKSSHTSSSSSSSSGSGSSSSTAPPLSAKKARERDRFRPESPSRPTRLHPLSGLDLKPLDPHAAFPPPHHARSVGARHARNLPHALVRKLGRRAGRIPFSWDRWWFEHAMAPNPKLTQ